MNTVHSSPEHEPLEPSPSLDALFDGIADIALLKGEYVDSNNGADAPSYSIPLMHQLLALQVRSIDFSTPFKDVEGTEYGPVVHLVWNEGPITKNVSLYRADDGSVEGYSMSEFNDEGERDDICDPDEHMDFDRLYEYLDDINRLKVTEEERRTAGRILEVLREQYGL